MADYFEKEMTHTRLRYLEHLRRAVGDGDALLVTRVQVPPYLAPT